MPAAKKKTASPRKKKLHMIPLSRPVTPQDIIDRARQFGPACLNALADEAANGAGSVRISAATALLDRGFGRPGQNVSVSGSQSDPISITMNMSISPAVGSLLQTLQGEEGKDE